MCFLDSARWFQPFELTESSDLFIYSDCRQQDLLKKVVEVKAKRPKVSSPSGGNQSTSFSSNFASKDLKPVEQVKEKDLGLNEKRTETMQKENGQTLLTPSKPEGETEVVNPVKSLLGLAYESSDDED